jgi:hypothetical protein
MISLSKEQILCMVETRNANKISGGTSEVKRPLGTPNHRWQNNIK